eukprot:15483166-Alexandrium_andersonii.AAC.1
MKRRPSLSAHEAASCGFRAADRPKRLGPLAGTRCAPPDRRAGRRLELSCREHSRRWHGAHWQPAVTRPAPILYRQ